MSDIERCYEELRRVIDGGSESMTHADALATVKIWSKWTAPSAEPVAWRIAGRFGWTYQEEPPYDAQQGRVAEPLYLHPAPSAEPVAWSRLDRARERLARAQYTSPPLWQPAPDHTAAMRMALDWLTDEQDGADADCGEPACGDCMVVRKRQVVIDALRAALGEKG